MNGFIFTLLLIVFIIWLRYELNKSKRHMNESSDNFWEAEDKANSTRKQSIDNLDYICLDTKPFTVSTITNCGDTYVDEFVRTITSLADKKILNLTGITNTELKSMYGAANITKLSEYDENYTQLVNTISRLGERLISLGLKSEATAILEYGVDIGSDVGANYYMLANLYKENGEHYKTDKLLLAASSLNTINKTAIINRINSIRTSDSGTSKL